MTTREREKMYRLLSLLIMFIASAAFSQTPLECKKASSDTHFRPPTQMFVGHPPGIGLRSVIPLFSENGIDFYGLDLKKYQTGGPINENGVWIVGVFEDENLREVEAQRLMQRLQNPNLDAGYAAGLKFVMVNMDLKDDRESEKYKAWLKCSALTSSTSKCSYPPQVPTVSEVLYYQPQQCLVSADARGLLLDDSLPGIAYTYHQYKAPPPLSFRTSLLKAANLLRERFSVEDSKKQ